MRRLLASTVLSLLICGSLIAQEVITARFRHSTPAGTAPVIIGPTTAISTVSTGGSGNFGITVQHIGDTLLWSIVDGSGNTAAAPTSSHSETITCTAYHNFALTGTGSGGGENRICTLLTSTTGSYTITNLNNQGTATVAGIILELQCQESPSAQCVIDQLAYQDTAATGAAGTATAGSIMTSHQLNELIIGGFFVANWNGASAFNGVPTQVSPYVVCPAEINPACMQISSFNHSYAVLERDKATTAGTFQATTTWTVLGTTAGFTMSIY